MKFLRKFRFNLIVTRRFKNYLLYAIGEVVLVMIGILLALEVNNWNEQRKNRIKEQVVYTNLLNILDQDLEHVNQKIENIEKSIEAIEFFILNKKDSVLMNHSMKEVNQKLINTWSVSKSFMPNKAYYSKLLNTNQLDLIQSEELKVQVIKLYEHFYVRYNDLDLNIEEMSVFHLQNNYFSLIIDKQFETGNLTVDYKTFLENFDVLNTECRKIYNLAKNIHGAMIDCKNHIELLMYEITNEITLSED